MPKYIICPSCGSTLEIDEATDPDRSVECGNCHCSKPLFAFLRAVPAAQQQQAQQAPARDGSTKPAMFSGPTQQVPAQQISSPPAQQQLPTPPVQQQQQQPAQPPPQTPARPPAPRPLAIDQLLCPSCGGVVTVFDNTNLSEPVACPRCGFSEMDTRFPDAPKKRVVCPKCSKTLEVFMDKAGALRCPNCKMERDIKSYGAPKAPGAAGGTVVSMPMAASTRLTRPATLEVVEGDCCHQKIVLLKGENTIGRRGANSTCSIQLETGDAYMSQNHARVELVVRPDRTYEYRISDLGSRNAVLLNDRRLGPGEVMPLRPNDLIRIGGTVLRFVHLRIQ